MDTLTTKVLQLGLGSSDLVDGYFSLGEGLRVQAALTQQREHAQGHAVMLAFRAVQDALFPEGIEEVTVGVGTTQEEAVDRAVKVWIEGTLPVLQELLQDGDPNPKIDHLDLAAADLQEKKVFLWDVLLGPLQATGLSQEELQNLEGENHEIFQAILDAVTGLLTERRLLWINCSITKQPGGEIAGDCWLNNQPWQEGLAELRQLAASWPRRPTLQIRRQFIVCRPTDRRSPEAEEALREQIAAFEAQNQKQWWQFWK